MNIEFIVSGKQAVITKDAVVIWDRSAWDGLDEARQEELDALEDKLLYVMYDRLDGMPYYWNYPVEAVVDVIDKLVTNLQVFQVRDYAGDNCELFIMADGRRFTREYTFPGMYYFQEVDAQNIYWIKEEYCDPKTMELRAFLVTDEA